MLPLEGNRQVKTSLLLPFLVMIRLWIGNPTGHPVLENLVCLVLVAPGGTSSRVASCAISNKTPAARSLARSVTTVI
jgi:hypothetical protein